LNKSFEKCSEAVVTSSRSKHLDPILCHLVSASSVHGLSSPLLWYSTFVDPTWLKLKRKIQLSFPSENEQQVYRTLWCYHTATTSTTAISSYFVAACYSMHFQCLNGGLSIGISTDANCSRQALSRQSILSDGYGPKSLGQPVNGLLKEQRTPNSSPWTIPQPPVH
jgi:hypothetical protein